MSVIDEFKSALRKDPTFKTFREIAQKVFDTINTEKIRLDVRSLHDQRMSRGLSASPDRFNPHKLVDVNSQEASVRGRLVSMQMELLVQRSTLRSAIDAITEHIRAEYYEDFLKDRRNVADRDAMLAVVLKRPREALMDIDCNIELVNAVLNDVDRTSFRLSEILKSLELITEKTMRGI